jgi:hypothetical protein
MDDVNRLYDIAATFGFSRDQVGVPFLCLTSAVIVTLLLLLGTPPAVLQFAASDKDE